MLTGILKGGILKVVEKFLFGHNYSCRYRYIENGG